MAHRHRTTAALPGSWGAVSATPRPGWSRRKSTVGRAWCGRWRDRTTGNVSDTQDGFDLVEGDLQLPAPVLEPFQDPGSASAAGTRYAGPEWRRSPGGLGSAPSIVRTPGLPPVPDRRLGGEFHGAGDAAYQAIPRRFASYIRLLGKNFPTAPCVALQWRATVLARLTGWRWRIQRGVQTQSGDRNGFTEATGSSGANQHGIAVVAHQHQGSVGQPAAVA